MLADIDAFEQKPSPHSFSLQRYQTVNRFRTARGKVLRRLIASLVDFYGRDVKILDVGGRPDYWLNVGFDGIKEVELLNIEPAEIERCQATEEHARRFVRTVGDARDLSDYADGSVDLVHSNSVIEHVGAWGDMARMAREMLRVGRAGWIQTPAWEFPFEPHFRVPFMHWFGRPLQARMLSLSCVARIRQIDPLQRRHRVDGINLLSRAEVSSLFPKCDVYTERFILPKSYSAYWMPPGSALQK